MAATTVSDAEAAFYDRLDNRNLRALWQARIGVDLTRPKSPAVAAMWRHADFRADMAEAGELITAEDAFRRVLVLENPAFRGEMRIANTLFAGLQLVQPGEKAPCHRHSQSAFRFVIEGEGAYTSVDGERTPMFKGDLVVTPAWTWHDHNNTTSAPVMWMDALDTPLVDAFDTVFREFYDEGQYPDTRPVGDSTARYGSGMVPLGHAGTSPSTPVINYPYARTREALEDMRRADDYDPCHGLKMQYVNPANGDHPTPTMAAFLQLLPSGFATAPYRSTDSAVYCVVEGTGRTVADDETFAWGPGDIIAIPGWHAHHHEADEDAVLFSYSDRAAQQKLGLWREARGDNAVA